MKKVFLLKEVAKAVREKLIAKKGISYKADHRLLAKALLEEYPGCATTIENLTSHITSYTKAFTTDVSIDSQPMKTFFLFCQSLKYGPELKEEDNRFNILKSILEQLKEHNVISEDLYVSQRAKWNKKGEDSQEYEYFACYYSKGLWHTGLALLKVDIKWSLAFLEFFDEPSKHNGTITRVEGSSNVFIQLKDELNHFLSLISIKPVKNAPVEKALRFNGSYSSVLSVEDGKPVAGKLILIKKKSEEEIRNAKDLKNTDYFPELYNGRVKFDNPVFRSDQLNPFISCYEAYWLLVSAESNIEIRQIKFEIMKEGICRFTDPHGEEFWGEVLQCDEKVLKLGIDPNWEGTNFRSQMIFDLSQKDKDYLDGVYSGQRRGWGKIMGGKIRLYKSPNKKYEDLQSVRIQLKDATKKLEDRAQALQDFFYGSDPSLPSYKFIQPSQTTVLHTYGMKIGEQIRSQNYVQAYKGFYTLYRLDSSMTRINRYNLEIGADGIVRYSLRSNEVIEFEGDVTFRENCLFLHIKKKQENPYNALCILYVGPQKDSSFQFTSGVYATNAIDGSPICGRAVLQKNSERLELQPVEINSEEYFNAKNQDKEIMELLSGTENNFIKSRRQINFVKRKISYGNVFFSHACKGDLEITERVKYIKLAFIHGFTHLEKLNNELKENSYLQPLANAIFFKEEPHSVFEVNIDYREEEFWTYKSKRKEPGK